MKKSSLLLRLEGGGVREQDKLDRREEVRLSRSISTHDHIVPLVKGAYDSPFTVGLEPLQNHFCYIHCREMSARLPSIKSKPYVRISAMFNVCSKKLFGISWILPILAVYYFEVNMIY